jgi:hypothetical protein
MAVSDYEDCCLLGCDSMQSGRMFTNVSEQPSTYIFRVVEVYTVYRQSQKTMILKTFIIFARNLLVLVWLNKNNKIVGSVTCMEERRGRRMVRNWYGRSKCRTEDNIFLRVWNYWLNWNWAFSELLRWTSAEHGNESSVSIIPGNFLISWVIINCHNLC